MSDRCSSLDRWKSSLPASCDHSISYLENMSLFERYYSHCVTRICLYISYNPQPSIASTIMGVYVRYVPFESCVKATSTYAALVKDDYHLCYGNSGKDACFGDSGGALADTTTIYGIVSFGYHCGIVPGVYVKVSYYREWIDDVMKLY